REGRPSKELPESSIYDVETAGGGADPRRSLVARRADSGAGRMNAMKRIPRQSSALGVMDLFDVIGPSADLKLNDSGVLQTFLNSVSDAFTSAQGTPTLLHGRRVEAMFAYVAAALGKCIAIKEEDAGDLYASSTDLQAPDYRLILNDETEILVEVKNCHKRRLTAPLTFSPQYIQKLRNYEATFRR